MSNPYTDYKKAFPSGGDSGLFAKLDPDTTTKFRIMSDAYYSIGEYTDPDTNETTHSDKYSWIVWNYDLKKAQILSKGVSVFNRIVELAEDEDWGDPQKYDIKISRTGTGLETRYSIVPGKQGEPTDEMSDAAANVDIESAVKGATLIQDRVNEQNTDAGKVFN